MNPTIYPTVGPTTDPPLDPMVTWETVVGGFLCLIGSLLANGANIILLCQTKENVRREQFGIEHLPCINWYIFFYVMSWVFSVTADTLSQVMITQQLWAAISCLDAFWYLSFSVIFVGHTFIPLEFVPLIFLIAGIGITGNHFENHSNGSLLILYIFLAFFKQLETSISFLLFEKDS